MAGPYDNIREGAMNPPAGAAAGYEDMLWNQMLEASQQEEQRYLQSLRDASNRALDRSGWYNVGSMLIPQDAGDVALSAAMGPGLGRGMRTALAALGGLTTQPGEAEGAFLPRSWFRELLGAGTPAVRRMGNEGLEQIHLASEELRRAGLPTRVTDSQLFPDMLDITQRYNVLPNNNELTALLDPTRSRDFSRFEAEIAQMRGRRPGSTRTYERRDLVADPAFDYAAGRMAPASEQNISFEDLSRFGPTATGAHWPSNGLIGIDPWRQTAAEAIPTLDHELQHWVQQRAMQPRGGANVGRVQRDNPGLWNEYLQQAQVDSQAAPGWTSVTGGMTFGTPEQDAAFSMYQRHFGEWEARLAAETDARMRNSGGNRANALRQALPDFNSRNAWPDFRIQ